MSIDADGWTPLRSSNLKRIRIAPPATVTLEVEFVSGAVWSYAGLPEPLVMDLANSDSPGRFFAQQIKGKFQETKLRDAPPRDDAREEMEAVRRALAEDLRRSAEGDK